jgi:hypothetical protein
MVKIKDVIDAAMKFLEMGQPLRLSLLITTSWLQVPFSPFVKAKVSFQTISPS